MVQVKALYDHTKAVYVQMIEPNVKPYTRVYTLSERSEMALRLIHWYSEMHTEQGNNRE